MTPTEALAQIMHDFSLDEGLYGRGAQTIVNMLPTLGYEVRPIGSPRTAYLIPVPIEQATEAADREAADASQVQTSAHPSVAADALDCPACRAVHPLHRSAT